MRYQMNPKLILLQRYSKNLMFSLHNCRRRHHGYYVTASRHSPLHHYHYYYVNRNLWSVTRTLTYKQFRCKLMLNVIVNYIIFKFYWKNVAHPSSICFRTSYIEYRIFRVVLLRLIIF